MFDEGNLLYFSPFIFRGRRTSATQILPCLEDDGKGAVVGIFAHFQRSCAWRHAGSKTGIISSDQGLFEKLQDGEEQVQENAVNPVSGQKKAID